MFAAGEDCRLDAFSAMPRDGAREVIGIGAGNLSFHMSGDLPFRHLREQDETLCDLLMRGWFVDRRGRVIQFETTATYATSLGTVTCTCPPE